MLSGADDRNSSAPGVWRISSNRLPGGREEQNGYRSAGQQ